MFVAVLPVVNNGDPLLNTVDKVHCPAGKPFSKTVPDVTAQVGWVTVVLISDGLAPTVRVIDVESGQADVALNL